MLAREPHAYWHLNHSLQRLCQALRTRPVANRPRHRRIACGQRAAERRLSSLLCAERAAVCPRITHQLPALSTPFDFGTALLCCLRLHTTPTFLYIVVLRGNNLLSPTCESKHKVLTLNTALVATHLEVDVGVENLCPVAH